MRSKPGGQEGCDHGCCRAASFDLPVETGDEIELHATGRHIQWRLVQRELLNAGEHPLQLRARSPRLN